VIVRYTRPIFVIFVLVTLQTTLFAQAEFFGAKADIVLLLPIAAGIAGGADRGASVGFVSGLALDLVVNGTPVGFFALGFTLAGYMVGMTQAGVLRAAWWIPVLTAIAGSVLGEIGLGLVGKFLGREDVLNRQLLAICAAVAVVNAVLILPMLRIVRWALPMHSRSGRLVPT
jgi:rod shape-determining protein MreD